jgi:hypothetical protein
MYRLRQRHPAYDQFEMTPIFIKLPHVGNILAGSSGEDPSSRAWSRGKRREEAVMSSYAQWPLLPAGVSEPTSWANLCTSTLSSCNANFSRS